MKHIRIKKGLDLPIQGSPRPIITEGPPIQTVALLGPDYVGLRPGLVVAVGDRVRLGETVLIDKRRPEIRFTAPASGRVIAIHRGEKRAFLSLVIAVEGEEAASFEAYSPGALPGLSREAVIQSLLDSGLWTALRARPFGRVADPNTRPHALFVTAMDTEPLAPSVSKILDGQKEAFQAGLTVISRLTEGPVFVCRKPEEAIPVEETDKVRVVAFSGPHPAGLPGTHIHFLDPVHLHKTVWHLGAQDVAAIGTLFLTGRLEVSRVIALAGPSVKDPRLLRTRLGASIDELVEGEIKEGPHRRISGSALNGHTASGPLAFLGRYHQQVSVLPIDTRRRFLGWLTPGWRLFSTRRVVASFLLPKKSLSWSTDPHGGHRAMVPIGAYEKVMPLDILPTHLLRALAVDDIEEAEKLGCLELVEEDLSLCTFVCPSKIDHGVHLRRVLNLIEKEEA